MCEGGLPGRPDCADSRRRFLRKIGLPPRLSKKELLEVLNTLYTRDALRRECEAAKPKANAEQEEAPMTEPSNAPARKIAFCGLVCSECPVWIATQAGDRAAMARLAQEYSTPDFAFAPDDMVCRGCDSPAGANEKMCAGCPIRQCGMGRGLPHCAACPDYPCRTMEQYIPADSDRRRRLDSLAEAY